MLDKTSKIVLKAVQKLHSPDKTTIKFSDICDETGLVHNEVFTACEHLVESDLAVYHHKGIDTSGNPAKAGIRLKHTAKHQREFTWLRFKAYIKENWMAILAILISIYALIQSGRALSMQQSELELTQQGLSSESTASP